MNPSFSAILFEAWLTSPVLHRDNSPPLRLLDHGAGCGGCQAPASKLRKSDHRDIGVSRGAGVGERDRHDLSSDYGSGHHSFSQRCGDASEASGADVLMSSAQEGKILGGEPAD